MAMTVVSEPEPAPQHGARSGDTTAPDATPSSTERHLSDVIQQPTVAAFLADRVRSQVMRDRHRCTGISSDALSLYGVRGGPEPRMGQYPADRSDLNACERTYLMAPDDVRERMLPVLAKYRAHVAARYADLQARGVL